MNIPLFTTGLINIPGGWEWDGCLGFFLMPALSKLKTAGGGTAVNNRGNVQPFKVYPSSPQCWRTRKYILYSMYIYTNQSCKMSQKTRKRLILKYKYLSKFVIFEAHMFLLEPTFLWRVITISGCEKTQGFGAGQWQDCGHSNRGVTFWKNTLTLSFWPFGGIKITQKKWLVYYSGQIIATSHDLTPNGGLVREIPLFQGNLGWWNIIIWPDYWVVATQICFIFTPKIGEDSHFD